MNIDTKLMAAITAAIEAYLQSEQPGLSPSGEQHSTTPGRPETPPLSRQ